MDKGIFCRNGNGGLSVSSRNLKEVSAEEVIPGCAEVPILIKQEDKPIPVFDTADIHATAAVNFTLDL
jgi:aspartate racemase